MWSITIIKQKYAASELRFMTAIKGFTDNYQQAQVQFKADESQADAEQRARVKSG